MKNAPGMVVMMGLALSGCYASPTYKVSAAAALAAASWLVFEKEAGSRDVFGDSTLETALWGALGTSLLMAGAAHLVSIPFGYSNQSSFEAHKKRTEAAHELSLHIRQAARAERCDAAVLMLMRLAKGDLPMAQRVLDSEAPLRRCTTQSPAALQQQEQMLQRARAPRPTTTTTRP